MSLINDALKQVGRTKPPAAAGAESSLTLRPVEAAKHGAAGTRIVLVALAALLAMLNSCAPGVTVVNIDNGFGAGVFAARVARRANR